MPVVHTNRVKYYLDQLDHYYTDLRKAVEGNALSETEAAHYAMTEHENPTLVRVNDSQLIDAISHFKVSVDALKRLTKEGRNVKR